MKICYVFFSENDMHMEEKNEITKKSCILQLVSHWYIRLEICNDYRTAENLNMSNYDQRYRLTNKHLFVLQMDVK